jgi:hypothetical protein
MVEKNILAASGSGQATSKNRDCDTRDLGVAEITAGQPLHYRARRRIAGRVLAREAMRLLPCIRVRRIGAGFFAD